MATSSKYGRITTEFGDIPDDEVVFVLRAKDLLSHHIIALYGATLVLYGLDSSAVRATLVEFEVWQAEHADRMKLPD